MKPASEIGGILLGSFSEQSGSISAIIAEPEFVAGEAQLFNNSRSDLKKLVAAIEKARHGATAIGYFRSHIREGLCLSDQDRELIECSFRDPRSIFLVVHPFEMGICMAGFFFWEKGELRMDYSDLEVPFITNERDTRKHDFQPVLDIPPFEAPEHIPEELSADAIASEQAPVEEPKLYANTQTPEIRQITEPKTEPPAPPPIAEPDSRVSPWPGMYLDPKSPVFAPEPPRKSFKRFLPAASVLVVFGTAAYLGVPKLKFLPRLNMQTQQSTATPGLGLKVDRLSDGRLDLTWNRSLPDLARTDRAKLSIIDGGVYRQLDLDSNQLRSGKVTYFPTGGDVQFRLEADLDPNHSVSELVRVLTPNLASGKDANTGTLRTRGPAGTQTAGGLVSRYLKPIPTIPTGSSDSERRETMLHAKMEPVTKRTVSSAQPKVEKASTGSSTHLRATAPAQVSAGAAKVENKPPVFLDGAIAQPATTTAHTDLKTRRVPGFPGAHTQAAQQQRTAEPAAQTSRAQPAVIPQKTLNVPQEPESIDSLPRPLRQVVPDVKPLRYSLLDDEAHIKVAVKINEAGRVVEAHEVSSGSSRNAPLAMQALNAAWQWVFEPAKIHGKNVPGAYLIEFRFRRPN